MATGYFLFGKLSHLSKIANRKSSITNSKSLFLPPDDVSQIDFDVTLGLADRRRPKGPPPEVQVYHMNFKLSWPMRGSLALVTKPNWLSLKSPLGLCKLGVIEDIEEFST